MRRLRPGSLFAVVAVAAMVGLWGYLFLLADPGVPDQLDDPGFAEAAQERCADAQSAIDQLPPAEDAEGPEDRAPVVAQANEVIGDLVAELRALAPSGDDGRLVGLWLDDWDTYLSDRQTYAENLAAGEDAELLITARGAEQITVTIDHFAEVNDMLDCQVPLDA
jgi:hypothetical protein